MTKKKSMSPLYASLLSRVKEAIQEDRTHEESFPVLREIADIIEQNHIGKEELCRFSGKDAYWHNRYNMGVFYLRLAECYDPDVSSVHADDEMAVKYYEMSEQPPAKWRLARKHKQKGLETVAKKMMSECIDTLTQDHYNTQYFGKRLEYLIEIFRDLHDMTKDSSKEYNSILHWVISNKDHIKICHQDALCELTVFEVACDQTLMDELLVLMQ